MRALTLYQPWASLCVIPRPCSTCDGVGHLGPATGSLLRDYGKVCPYCPGPFKTIETRPWPAPKSLIGQRIAIHAAAKPPPNALNVGPFQVLRPRGTKPHLANFADDGRPWSFADRVDRLPLGAVVGTAVLADCVPMVEPNADYTEDGHDAVPPLLEVHGDDPWKLTLWDAASWPSEHDVTDQLPFGHFAPGRWAWLLTDAERFAEPIPATGRQGIWNWESPQ